MQQWPFRSRIAVPKRDPEWNFFPTALDAGLYQRYVLQQNRRIENPPRAETRPTVKLVPATVAVSKLHWCPKTGPGVELFPNGFYIRFGTVVRERGEDERFAGDKLEFRS